MTPIEDYAAFLKFLRAARTKLKHSQTRGDVGNALNSWDLDERLYKVVVVAASRLQQARLDRLNSRSHLRQAEGR